MSSRSGGIGLALAGGGPEGAVYEIGALRALDEALDGLHLTELDMYVGVSAGAFVGACLANKLDSALLCRKLVKPAHGEFPFSPKVFFTPAVRELLRRGSRLPGLFVQALREYAADPEDMSLLESLLALAQALPVGVFDNDGIRQYVHDLFSRHGRTDDFRKLDHKLVVVAAELCSGRAVRFGTRGLDHIPISQAVQASSAFPGLYPPVEISGRHYVDGVLLKTLHASVALDAGADLLFCINPIVPVDACRLRKTLLAHGLPSVLSQTFRTLIHSRMTVGMEAYRTRYRKADVILFEPRRDDYEMFFTNIFSFAARKQICEGAYRNTRRDLIARADELEPILARHGITLRRDVLEDDSRDLWSSVGIARTAKEVPVVTSLDRALRQCRELVARSGSRRATSPPRRPPAAPCPPGPGAA